ncbi:MaoC family dehydratase [Sphingomonas colocasiae]|uniref:MaoC family dehydratase n=1 Tax=Sphingomonas colocasiae TaxID=1848973 RepID=A0ABS7PWJ0_9SPHN|nr:MaoC family dehydratase [Sphingomonas colocasiae]MBY8825643.1 MaoC family dehydratase [Sphingomonas colocasiae]
MTPGTLLTPFVVEAVSPGAMREWSVFLADPNPIHLDAEAVRAAGLGDRPINQGPANLAYLINLLSLNFPEMDIVTLETRFNGNVFAGDRCVAGGHVIEVGETGVRCEIWLDVDGGGRAVSANASVRKRARP